MLAVNVFAISVFAHIRYKQAMDSEYSDSYVSKHSQKYTSAPSSPRVITLLTKTPHLQIALSAVMFSLAIYIAIKGIYKQVLWRLLQCQV